MKLLLDGRTPLLKYSREEAKTMNESFESVLNAARQLPLSLQKLLAEQLLENLRQPAPPITDQQAAALAAVEQTRGTIKGLDRETVIWLAEDDEHCGY